MFLVTTTLVLVVAAVVDGVDGVAVLRVVALIGDCVLDRRRNL